MKKRKALGKGLSALIPDVESLGATEGVFFQCPIEAIEPNPYQPRKEFFQEEMAELVRSVKEKGVLTPILVSRTDQGYRLIAGERRWRAAQKAGLKTIPVVVRESTPLESLELALIENIHRKDLNPLEEALAYKKWLEDSHTTQEALAKRVGKDRSTIANMLRLLTLPKDIQKDLIEGRLSMGHARVIAGLKDPAQQKKIRDAVIRRSLSVRQVETMATKSGRIHRPKSLKPRPDPYLESLADDLKRSLGTKVEITKQGNGGRITVYFYSNEELDRLLDVLAP
jgi:ParB family chromosome partitioning protein